MRPTGIEALRAIQTALTEVIGPELQTAFAQDTQQTLQMLLESVIAEMDSAASDLLEDNGTLSSLLEDFRAAVSANANNRELSGAIEEIDESLARPDPGSFAISELAARNEELRAALEKAVRALEGVGDDPGYESLAPVRMAMYRHLRDVAGRGWSFWDAASFREYMMKHRSERTG
ncbi:MAG: hypothetical protein IH957_10125 [Chloroflexi bacterium]|nr:hypothetical protein [Chloroflexota bacterium]